MENKVKHLEMIQGIINRMASNSFVLKGWAITLIAGFFALSNKDSNKMFFLIAYIPLIIFWGLDTHYLKLERKYRNLYDKVRMLNNDKIDFSMKITDKELTEKIPFANCFFSLIEIGFYLPTAVLILVVIILIK